jgi:hypothetical protein
VRVLLQWRFLLSSRTWLSALPPQIQQALGELVGAAREGLLALSVGVGLGVVHELMEAEVVRHEALSDRRGERPRRWAVAAA